MSYSRGYGLNGKSIYANVAKPMITYLQFTVNAADTGGLGITSLKSNGFVESVFMHTSQTPGEVNGVTNPNPPAGYALVRFKNNFNYWLAGYEVASAPTTSNSTTSTTANDVFVITSLGTTTTAQWQAVGVPQGITPAVGLAFVATATQAIGGTGTVGVPAVPATSLLAVVGNPNSSIASSNISQFAGAQLMLQFSAAGSVTAPADGSVVYMQLAYDGSTVTIDGI